MCSIQRGFEQQMISTQNCWIAVPLNQETPTINAQEVATQSLRVATYRSVFSMIFPPGVLFTACEPKYTLKA